LNWNFPLVNWLCARQQLAVFDGSDRGAHPAAFIATLIMKKLNEIDPQQ